MQDPPDTPQQPTGQTAGANEPDSAASRPALERQLAELTLPLMWSLRQASVRAFEPLGLRPVRVLLLELIARGLAHPKDLADVLDAVPPAVSNMLGELEARGYVRRDPDPDDGRRVRLELTPDGRAVLAEIQRRWLELSSQELAVLSDDELRLLIGAYRKLLGQEATP